MTDSRQAFTIKEVVSGRLERKGADAVLSFDAEDGGLDVHLPAAELASLISVCLALQGERLPEAGELEHPTIPVADWRVGVSASEGVVLGFAPQAGGALALRLTPAQAREMVGALGRALELLAESQSAPAAQDRRH